ncbi:MAG: glutamine synthetase, partial [Elusimicrobia bacterium]|nr:glutamine synthetase [Elusimicrobiota bacterium]
AGSSFHLHASLWDKGLKKNLLWDERKKAATPLFGSVTAGSLALARDFSLFFAPTVNSYKRYVASSFAPTKLAWGRDNRTCGFRVVGGGGSFRLENRVPGADANPYLAFAATIAAFLHGAEKGLKTPREFTGDAYHAKGLAEVPRSLGEAAHCWEASAAARSAFGPAVHRHYLRAARWELECFERAVTCWERARYFERI